MPLDKSGSKASVGTNIKREMSEGKPQKQAVAIALDVARRAKRADGGKVHVGPIISHVAGRTDHHDMNVPNGSFVIPADVVSGLGEGNSLAGMKVIERMFPQPRADGGSAAEPVPIAAAGGEVVLSPEQLTAKFGDLDHAHKTMDHWVVHERKKIVKTMSKLPPPAQD
jgi:hypothetical protein